ncbi:helix-turn-helix domain-containing protein [Rhizobium sp. PAMB 3182]
MMTRPTLDALREHDDSTDSLSVSQRWEGITNTGFIAVPNLLLLNQARLGLTSEELNVLLNLLVHWWRPEDFVFPRSETIATRMGVSQRSTQRALRSLATKGMIVRRRTGDLRSYYDLGPLIEKLKPLADRATSERAAFQTLSAFNGPALGNEEPAN